MDGQDDEALLPEPLRGLGLGAHEIKHQGQTWHVLVVQPPKGMLYLRYDATTHETRVHEFGWIVLFLGAICIAAAFAMRSEEHTSELKSLMRISYAVSCMKKKK